MTRRIALVSSAWCRKLVLLYAHPSEVTRFESSQKTDHVEWKILWVSSVSSGLYMSAIFT
jgi:hypothetical protein